MFYYARAAAVALAAALLTACSGGGGSASNSLTPSSSAQQSLVATSASDAPSSSSHSPPPTAQSSARRVTANQYGPSHAPTFEQLPGDYQSSQGGWNTVGQYVTYVMTDKRGAQYAANAGMKVGFYTDVLKLHDGNENRYSDSALAHSCNGQRVYTATSGTRAYVGDPGNPALLTSWNSDIQSMLHDQWGSYPYTWLMSDDSDDPGSTWDPSQYRYGSAWGPVASPVYCGYTQNNWFTNTANLLQNANLPVIFNGDTDPKYFAYMRNKPNVIGGECEGCIASPFIGNGQTKLTGDTWKTQMNAGLIDIANQKIFFLSADGDVPADTLGYTYASYMLMYDQNFTLFRQDASTPSGIGNPPTIKIVPTQPLISTPSDISQLNFGGTGVYAREYAACYIEGQLVGPCAALVNPDANTWHGWPFLNREYHHLLQFGGQGAANALGDNGWANANGPHPGNGLSGGGWAIAFN